MNSFSLPQRLRLTAIGALILSSAVAWAERPDFAGGPHGRSGGNWHAQQQGHWERQDERDAHENRGERGHRGGHYRWDEDRQWREDRRPAAGPRLEPGAGRFFHDTQRRSVHDFYAPRMASGHCPPGLAKKGTGCLPPGQARQWAIGQRLPGGVVSYPLPAELRLRLGSPPPGYEFVRVASDILLIAVGTSLVIDAIDDLGRR